LPDTRAILRRPLRFDGRASTFRLKELKRSRP
jgi:hypothetical protein